jgi:hypothetical protein
MIGQTNAWLTEALRGLGQLALPSREVFALILSGSLNRHGLLDKPRSDQEETPSLYTGKEP